MKWLLIIWYTHACAYAVDPMTVRCGLKVEGIHSTEQHCKLAGKHRQKTWMCVSYTPSVTVWENKR
jgi:hypothetical protein